MQACPNKIISWIEENLTYPSGPVAGQPVVLLPHEREFINGTFDPEVFEAGLSMPRGNSKTGLCSMIAAAATIPGGPLVNTGSQNIVVAGSVRQGRISFNDILYHFRTYYGSDWKKQSTRGGPIKVARGNTCEIHNTIDNTELLVLGFSPNRAHGLRLYLALLDEPARWEDASGKEEEMYEAITEAAGKIEGCKVLVLGTRSDNPEHFFERMLRQDDPSFFHMCFSAPHDIEDAVALEPATYMECNPLAPHSDVLRKKLERKARLAAESPIAMASFKGSCLNMGTPHVEGGDPLVDSKVWLASTKNKAGFNGNHVLGIDLGSRSAMSAGTGCWGDGSVETMGIVGSEAPDLRITDDRLIRSDWPIPAPEELLGRWIARHGMPIHVVADNYRSAELKPACAAYGLKLTILHGPDVADASLRSLDASLPHLAIPESALFNYCIGGARRVESSTGYKLARHTQGGRDKAHRDDPIAALLLACYTRSAWLTRPSGQTQSFMAA